MGSRRLPAKCILVTAILFLVCGCPYESDVPLSRIEDARIDKELLGKWLYRNAEQNDSGMIMISMFNEHELVIVIREDGKEDDDFYRAFSSVVDGEGFLNVQEISTSSKKRKWTFVNYAVAGDSLSVRIVEDRLFKGKIHSSEALHAFVKNHLKNPNLYADNDKKVLKRAGDKSGASQ